MHPHTYNQFYSWSETTVSVQHSGRSPGLKIFASAIFPVSQWYSCLSSLITVTSSYRICTYFPFHQSQLKIALTPDYSVFNSTYYITFLFFIQLIKQKSTQSKNPDIKSGFSLNSYEGGGDSDLCFNYLDTYYTGKMCPFCD